MELVQLTMSSPVPDPLVLQDFSIIVRNTFGPLFIGVILTTLLYGVTNVQAVIYFQTNKDRGMSLYKLAVIWLWILDTLSMVLVIHAMYYYLITNYANFSALLHPTWSFQLQTIPNTLIICGVHIMYSYRIWIVSRGRSRIFPAIVGIFVIGTSGIGIVFILEAYQVHTFVDAVSLDWAIYLTLSTMAFNDLIIASTLCYFLATSRTGFSSTDSLLTKLMVYTINTGALTSVTSLIAIISCALMQDTLIYLAIQLLLVRLYVISFLALINMRRHLRSEYSNTTDIRQSNNHRMIPLTLDHRKSNTETFGESEEKISQYSNRHDSGISPALPAPAFKPCRPTTTMGTGCYSLV